MRVNQVDALLLVLLVPFALRGYWRGFLRESLALVGLLGGALAAAAGGSRLAAALVARQLVPPQAARGVALALLFVVVYVAARAAGALADRLARAIFLGGVNRAAGLAFGVAKGAVVLGFALVLLQQFLPSPSLAGMLAASRLAPPLTQLANGVVEAGRTLAAPALGRTHV